MQEIEAWDGQAQGDKEDRDKIREVERARAAAAKRQSEADELTMEARNLAAPGLLGAANSGRAGPPWRGSPLVIPQCRLSGNLHSCLGAFPVGSITSEREKY